VSADGAAHTAGGVGNGRGHVHAFRVQQPLELELVQHGDNLDSEGVGVDVVGDLADVHPGA
jgi:hypothetical protein